MPQNNWKYFSSGTTDYIAHSVHSGFYTKILTFDQPLSHEVIVHGLSDDLGHLITFILNEGVSFAATRLAKKRNRQGTQKGQAQPFKTESIHSYDFMPGVLERRIYIIIYMSHHLHWLLCRIGT